MNLLELAQKRCSIRKYASSPVEDEKLAYILEAGRMAPSAVNFQPWYFVICLLYTSPSPRDTR